MVLKETGPTIETSTIIEDCPHCGGYLADTLRKSEPMVASLPKSKTTSQLPLAQTAFEMLKFKIDIEKLGKVMPLATSGSMCIVDYKADLLLTRLYVRALLPANHGGLGSPYAIVIDAGNKSDFYQTVNFVRQYGLHLKDALDRIIVSRTFTIYQLKRLLQQDLPRVIACYPSRIIVVPGLLDMFEDPNINKNEAKTILDRIMKSIDTLAKQMLVLVSFHTGSYAKLVMPYFSKQIVLSVRKNKKLDVELYDNGRSTYTVFTERELSIVKRTRFY